MNANAENTPIAWHTLQQKYIGKILSIDNIRAILWGKPFIEVSAKELLMTGCVDFPACIEWNKILPVSPEGLLFAGFANQLGRHLQTLSAEELNEYPEALRLYNRYMAHNLIDTSLVYPLGANEEPYLIELIFDHIVLHHEVSLSEELLYRVARQANPSLYVSLAKIYAYLIKDNGMAEYFCELAGKESNVFELINCAEVWANALQRDEEAVNYLLKAERLAEEGKRSNMADVSVLSCYFHTRVIAPFEPVEFSEPPVMDEEDDEGSPEWGGFKPEWWGLEKRTMPFYDPDTDETYEPDSEVETEIEDKKASEQLDEAELLPTDEPDDSKEKVDAQVGAKNALLTPSSPLEYVPDIESSAISLIVCAGAWLGIFDNNMYARIALKKADAWSSSIDGWNSWAMEWRKYIDHCNPLDEPFPPLKTSVS